MKTFITWLKNNWFWLLIIAIIAAVVWYKFYSKDNLKIENEKLKAERIEIDKDYAISENNRKDLVKKYDSIVKVKDSIAILEQQFRLRYSQLKNSNNDQKKFVDDNYDARAVERFLTERHERFSQRQP